MHVQLASILISNIPQGDSLLSGRLSVLRTAPGENLELVDTLGEKSQDDLHINLFVPKRPHPASLPRSKGR